jgi:hypothetical protein
LGRFRCVDLEICVTSDKISTLLSREFLTSDTIYQAGLAENSTYNNTALNARCFFRPTGSTDRAACLQFAGSVMTVS